MFCGGARAITSLCHLRLLQTPCRKCCSLYSTVPGAWELPRKLKSFERKPWVTHVAELKRIARLEKQQRILFEEATLHPPENGLLLKSLLPVAHRVLSARDRLFACASRVAANIPIYFCSVCGEVHVGDTHMSRTCDVSGSKSTKEHTYCPKWILFICMTGWGELFLTTSRI